MIPRRPQPKENANDPLILRAELVLKGSWWWTFPTRTRLVFLEALLLANPMGYVRLEALAAAISDKETLLTKEKARLLPGHVVAFGDWHVDVPAALHTLAEMGRVRRHPKHLSGGTGHSPGAGVKGANHRRDRWQIIDYNSFWEPLSEYLAKQGKRALEEQAQNRGEEGGEDWPHDGKPSPI